MPILIYDFETRSVANLTKVGAVRYASDPSTSVMCAAYCVDANPVELWVPGDPVPKEFIRAAADPDWIVAAFNHAFELAITQHIMHPRHGWPLVPLTRARCLQAAALAHALPASLAGVAAALGLEQQKDAAGRRIMLQMVQPRKARKGEDPSLTYWHDDADKHAALHAYCVQDVKTERALFGRIGFLSPAEQARWELDQVINARGVPIDAGLLNAAIRIAEAAQAGIGDELVQVTGGAVETINQIDRAIAWLASLGVEINNFQKGTVKAALRRKALPDAARRALELRLDGAHAAVNKLQAMRAWLGEDARARGCFRFHGASPGRWTSHGIQLQNLKRPETEDLGAAIAAVATGDLDHMQRLYAQPLSVVGDITRALIAAPPGSRLLAGDFSGVESRTLAWLSGQRSKLDMWAKFDRTQDPADDPYFILGLACGLAPDIARDTGKTADLAFGYMGSIGAWRNLAPEDDASTDEEIQVRKQAWRAAHPNTVAFWYALDRAAIAAVHNPGKVVRCGGKIAFVVEGDFLFMELPTGRRIAYPFPTLITSTRGEAVVSFKDRDQGRWTDTRHGHGAYGGIWTENAVQAVARDLLAAAMQRLENANYPIVLHVHDEIACECADDFGSVDEFKQILTATPEWAGGLPIAAKVRAGPRFAKIKPTEAAPMHEVSDAPPSVPELNPDPPAAAPPARAPKVYNIGAIFNITSMLSGSAALLAPTVDTIGILERPNGKEADRALLDAALAHAAAGRPVFPCVNQPGTDRHKRPLTDHGFKDATIDPNQIRAWWRSNPTALIGMPTGERSGIAVLDLDARDGKNGFLAIPDWETRTPVRVRTQSGGAHLYFQAEGAPRCSGGKIALGVDTRGQGGYVIVPPSPGYSWTNGSDFSNLPLWPDDLRPQERERAARVDPGPPSPLSEYDVARVKAALAVISSDEGYYSWFEIGSALRKSMGAAGWPLFDAWSRKSPAEYDEARCAKKWDDCKLVSKFNVNTIFEYANRAAPGWTKRNPPQRAAAGSAMAWGLGAGMPLGAAPEAAGASIPPGATRAAAPVVGDLGEWDAGEDDELWGDIPPRGWLLGNVFCRGFLSALVGDSGIGKTALRDAQLISLAIGRSLTGEHVFQRCRVLIISLEDNARELRRRIRAACIHYGVDRDELKGWLFIVSLRADDGKLMVIGKEGQPQRDVLSNKIEKAIRARKADIVSIDPFVKAHGVDENSNGPIDMVTQVLTDLAEKYDIAADVLHHTSKGLADPGNADRGRGASSMKASARLFYTLSTMSQDESKALGVPEGERKLFVRMDSGKVNITPPMSKARWFRLVGVPLGNATERYPAGDNVQTVEPWAPPEALRDMSDAIINDILDTIDTGLPDGRRYSGDKSARTRAAWRIVAQHCPAKPEAQAREVIKKWIETGLLIVEEYWNTKESKNENGLTVDDAKRPPKV